MATKRGWVIVSWDGRRYERLRIVRILGQKTQSWDQTEDRKDAHVFRTKKEAEGHIEAWKQAGLKTGHVERA